MNQRQQRQFVTAKQGAEKQNQGGNTAFRVPAGMGLYKIDKVGSINLDFAVYVVGKGNPSADEGFMYFERFYYCHGSVGSNNSMYCCPARMTRGRSKCPICEHRKEIWDKEELSTEQKKELTKNMNVKERQLFIVREAKDRDGPWWIWDFAFFNFGKLLKFRMDTMPEESDYDMFPHPEKGYSLALGVGEETTGSVKYKKVISIDFVKRKPLDYDPEEMPCLDDLLIVPTYDELRKVYLQLGDEEEVDPPKSAKSSVQGNGSSKKGSVPPDEDKEDDDENERPVPTSVKAKVSKQETNKDEGDDEEGGLPKWCKVDELCYYKGKECEIKRISRDGKTVTILDEDEDEEYRVSPSELKSYAEGIQAQVSGKRSVPVDDEEGEQPKPKKRNK